MNSEILLIWKIFNDFFKCNSQRYNRDKIIYVSFNTTNKKKKSPRLFNGPCKYVVYTKKTKTIFVSKGIETNDPLFSECFPNSPYDS